MNKPAYLLLSFCFILLIACQSDNKKTSANNSTPKDRLESLRKSPGNNLNISALRSQALSILDYRIKEDGEPYAIVEAGCWEYEFVFKGEMSKPGDHAGEWIDFKPDFTYQYGLYNEVQGSGRYHYSLDKTQILMVDNDESIKPQEWTAKNSGDVMILVGTSTYQDNATQMKLQRRVTCPQN